MSVSGAVNQNQEYGLVLIHFSVRGATRHAEQQQRLQRISIRAPREGSDCKTHFSAGRCLHFNPRSPRGERPVVVRFHFVLSQISIHAPREGSDTMSLYVRGVPSISIHAPREGSDQNLLIGNLTLPNFNPRSPRGERPCPRPVPGGRCPDFNPRSPRGERLQPKNTSNQYRYFNPRSPRGERLVLQLLKCSQTMNFNPRSPRGERRSSIPTAPGLV